MLSANGNYYGFTDKKFHYINTVASSAQEEHEIIVKVITEEGNIDIMY